MRHSLKLCILFSSTLVLTVASRGQQIGLEDLIDEDLETGPPVTINDPIEGFNRAIFKFNDGLYTKIVTPFARGYSKVVPDPIEKGVGNFFDNLKFPSRFAGNVLQGRLNQAGRETGKFLVNSTIGLGGILKPSDDIDGLSPSDEDIGQAFAKWGMGHGFYIVLPFLGPTSLRDFVGDFADGAVEPIPDPWTLIDDDTDRLILQVAEIVNGLPRLIEIYDSMRRSAIDPYASVRDGYAQRRARQVNE